MKYAFSLCVCLSASWLILKSKLNLLLLGLHRFMRMCMFVLQCSTTCGSGVQRRQVVCRVGHSQIVPDQLCLAAKKPRPEKKCDMRTCSDYMWKVGNWSEVCLTCTVEVNGLYS